MLRGARIDLQTARSAIDNQLRPVYARDARLGVLSDEAIGAVSTVFRCLEGALGKTTDGVARQYSPKSKPYYPIGNDRADFDSRFEHALPGVAARHPEIRDAFDRYQPYQPKRSGLKWLKHLYRENHHWDFTLQDVRFMRPPGISIVVGTEIVPSLDVESHVPGGWYGFETGDGRMVDWYFVKPRMSVAVLLEALYATSKLACEDISSVAGISS